MLIRIRDTYIEEGLNIQFIKFNLTLEVLMESLDVKSNTSFIDSIARNIDFI